MDSTDFAAAVAANISEASASAGMSVSALAVATLIPYSTLQRRLSSNGLSPVSVSELKAIADALGVTAASLATVRDKATGVAA